jgi:hypothetical protein
MSLEKNEAVPDTLDLCFFIPPAEEDAVGGEFGESFAYELSGAPETLKQFWDCVGKIKCFVFSVSSDEYFFRCKVDVETERVLDTTCSYRYLN